MVKLKGPAQSLAAAGQLGDALAFANIFKTTYLKKKSMPSNPNTSAQKAVRAIVKFLSQQWQHLPAPACTTWQALGTRIEMNRYNAYIKYNCDRWSHFQAPTMYYPATEATIPGAYSAYNQIAHYKWIDHIRRNILMPTLWGYWFHRSTSNGFFPSRLNVIGFAQASPLAWTHYTETPVETGTYYYRARTFYNDGTTGYQTGQATVIMP